MNNAEVKFIDTSKETVDLLKKLSKDGLKSSGKIITKILKEKIPVRTGGLKKSIVAWAKIDKNTGQPYMEVGYRSKAQMQKRGVKFFVNPTWFEFGTKPHGIETKAFAKTGKSSYELKDNNGNKFGIFVGHPGMTNKNFLRNTVYDNITEIREAQEEYIKQIQDITVNQGMSIDVGGDEEID